MITGPQPGRQELFLSTTADIAGFGGQANVGKTVALGLDPLRFLRTGERYGYSARTAMFRRTAKETTEAGGLADKLQELYRPLHAKYRGGKENDFHFDFRSEKGSGSLRIQIAHLPRVVDVYAWQGAELDCVAFDELTHFEEFQFWYLLSRLRSHSGDVPVRPYARFTCNPDPDSWVRSLVDWWIGEDGFAIEERAGVIRWFVRVDSEGDGIGELVWGDSAEELLERYPGEHPVSFTFVHGRREDNPSGSWGEYERKLANLPVYLRRQLLEGNWNARRPISGSIYRLPETALFNDTDANFIAALDQVHSTARQYGAWDYGRRSHALCWGGAVLQPGAPPVLWVVDFIGWPAGTDALAAAQERALRSGLPVLGLEAYAWQMDSGDPSGEAKDSGEGWAETLRAAGVPMTPVYHLYPDEQGRKVYWNTREGFERSVELVQRWLDSGRLRIRRSLAPLVGSIRNFRRAIPEGMAAEDVRAIHVPKLNDKWSHGGDVIRYLVAFVATQLQAEQARQTRPGKRRRRRMTKQAAGLAAIQGHGGRMR